MDDKIAPWFSLTKIAAVGARVAGFRLGTSVLVVGAGPIGQMSLRWAALNGLASLTVTDSVPLRLELAKRGGAGRVIGKPIETATAEIEAANAGHKPEIVVDTTGNPTVFASALKIVDNFGTVLLIGDTGTPSQQHLTQDVVLRGLHIVGAHDTHERPDWNSAGISRLFLDLVAAGRINMEGLNTHEFHPDDAVAAYDLATNRRAETMGILFNWTR